MNTTKLTRDQHDKVKLAACFQWAGILQSLAGLDDKQVSVKAGKAGTPCPVCGGRNRYSFKDEEKGGWACRKCGGGDGWTLLQKIHNWDYSTAAEEVGRYLGVVSGTTTINMEALKLEQEIRAFQRQENEQTKLVINTNKERKVWNEAGEVSGHPWVSHKQLSTCSLSVCRQSGSKLLIPVFSPEGERISHQWVSEVSPGTFQKNFHYGIPVAGGLVEFGAKQSLMVLVGESFADTDAALQLAGSSCVAVCAFSAGQIPAAVEYVSTKHPYSEIVICADNDDEGRKAVAKAAARVPGVAVSYPPSGKDWSEYLLSGGKESPLMNYEVIESVTQQSEPIEGGAAMAYTREAMQNDMQAWRDAETTIPILQPEPKEEFSFNMGSLGFNAEQDYLIKNYLPAERFGVIYGPSNSYKSFAAISWACSIATGKDWNGQRVKKGAVLYVAAEGGAGVPRRIRGWEMQHNGGEEITNLFRIDQPVYMGEVKDVAKLVHTISKIEQVCGEKIVAVFIDTLNRCFSGSDENRAADMGEFVRGCDAVKAVTGATFVVVHHSGKNGEIRGSSALFGACDFVFKVTRPDDQKPFYVVDNPKVKDGEQVEKKAFDMNSRHLFTDSDGDEVTTLVASLTGYEPPEEDPEEGKPQIKNLSPNHQAVWDCVRARTQAKQSTHRRIVLDDLKAQGRNISSFSKWVHKLVDDGMLTIDDDGNLHLTQSSD